VDPYQNLTLDPEGMLPVVTAWMLNPEGKFPEQIVSTAVKSRTATAGLTLQRTSLETDGVEGDGAGTGEGTGDGTGEGTGEGTGDGTGEGTGDGTEEGTGDGTGEGTGDGTGEGTGDGTGEGTGDGAGEGVQEDDISKASNIGLSFTPVREMTREPSPTSTV